MERFIVHRFEGARQARRMYNPFLSSLADSPKAECERLRSLLIDERPTQNVGLPSQISYHPLSSRPLGLPTQPGNEAHRGSSTQGSSPHPREVKPGSNISTQAQCPLNLTGRGLRATGRCGPSPTIMISRRRNSARQPDGMSWSEP